MTAWAASYYDVPLQKPADGVTPASERYTYSANDVSVGDVDGRAELMTKTAPGTRDGRQRYITMPSEDVRAGFKNTDDYRLSPEGYRQHLDETFRGWDRHPEVVVGRWPATLEHAFGIAPRYNYPLSTEQAAELVDYFIDVYAPSRSASNKLRQCAGFIVDGPEYLTVFEGATGRGLQTVR